MDENIVVLLDQNKEFILGLLNDNHGDEGFLRSKERLLLQGIVGIIDEINEMNREEEELKTLQELGDILFYIVVLIEGLSRYNTECLKVLWKTYENRNKLSDNTTDSMLSLSKKIAFQNRIDLLDSLAELVGIYLVQLHENIGFEGISLAIALMRYKLKKRYPNGYNIQDSIERKS
jgi:NTP pyrophosphatase (non-canonical NTP hydrolase)